MAESYDTTARLAEGTASVADVENYVSACQALGYQHPDLTAHAAQIRDWYGSEDGMNLRALDADCSALQTVSAVAEEAVASQDAQRAMLTTAWQGDGAQASGEFLRRHGEACAHAAAAVRLAAQALAELRESLWRAVDGKVSTVLAIDDGARARRAEWLAAAQTVTTGAGDRAVASELVDQEVKPFVDNVIGDRWLTAMRAAVDAIESAYDAAAAELASAADTPFEVPGGLGPTWTPAAEQGVTEPGGASGGFTPAASAAPVSPAGWSPAAGWNAPAATPPAVPAMAPSPPPAAAPAMPPAMPPATPAPDPGLSAPMAAPALPSLGGGGGLPDFGSGLAGIGQQLGNVLGGLLGDADTALDPPELDDLQDPDDPDLESGDVAGEESDEPQEDSTDPSDLDAAADADEPVDPATDVTCPPEPQPPNPADEDLDEPAATPPPEPLAVGPEPAPPPGPPAGPPLPAEAASESGTPCEIAADELPQVGE